MTKPVVLEAEILGFSPDPWGGYRAGYAADVLRVESSPVPWVVRIGGYSSREQAESAREALAKKGFRGGFIL